MITYNSPLVTQRADPFVTKYGGKYYFVGTYPDYDRIELRCAEHLNDLQNAPARVLWVKHEKGVLASNIWAPELHYVMGKWVIYFAAGAYPEKWRIRPYTLICDGDDPMTGNWKEGGKMRAAAGDPYSFIEFSLDMTVFENKGKWYTIWAQKSGKRFDISDLYIAELATPTRLKTVRRLLSTPDYDWERDGFWVNEGPNVLHHGGKLFVTFSASATGSMYCMGMLSADENSDVLDPQSWTKRNKPVLTSDASLNVYGPGHNCFVEGEEGETLCMLHFRSYPKIHGNPLLDHNRHAHVIKVVFDENDEPTFPLKKEDLYNVPFENELQKDINDEQ